MLWFVVKVRCLKAGIFVAWRMAGPFLSGPRGENTRVPCPCGGGSVSESPREGDGARSHHHGDVRAVLGGVFGACVHFQSFFFLKKILTLTDRASVKEDSASISRK